jgi:rubrerythrin
MEMYSIGEVIEQALQTEQLGYQYYSTMADRFKTDPALKELFDTLSEKELHHKAVFERLKATVPATAGEPNDWNEVTLYLRAIVESEFFLGKHKALPLMEHVKTISDAVDFAIGFEKETLLYFIGVRDVVEQKFLIDEIINEERSHIRWLSAFKGNLHR